MNRLNGKYALITGASCGLGRQLTIDFARAGAARIAIVARHAQALVATRDYIQTIAPTTKVLVIEADVAQSPDIERIVATTLSEFKGRVDILVNNAWHHRAEKGFLYAKKISSV